MTLKRYLLSLPERVVRSTLGLGAGVVREVGEVVLPDGLRRTQLYQNLVDGTLRFVIEQVGGVEGVYAAEAKLPDDFLARRTAGNAIEALGIIAFRASPVWVLAGLADLAGTGRQLIPQIADALKAEGLLEPEATFTNVDQLLNGLERTSSKLAGTINTPPLDVAALRADWDAIRAEARSLQPAALPSGEAVSRAWSQLTDAARQQGLSIFATSSAVAVSAVRVSATRTGQIMGAALLEHYRTTLQEIREAGYATYTARQLRPYVRAALHQFAPSRRTLTERLFGNRGRV